MVDFADLLDAPKGQLRGTALGAPSGGKVSVKIEGATYEAWLVGDPTISTNDTVILTVTEGVLYTHGRVGSSTPTPPTTPTAPPVASSGSLTVAPADTSSWSSSGYWQSSDNVRQGNYGYGNHTGAAFYGSTPRSLSGATVYSCGVYIRRPPNTGASYAAGTLTLALITQASRPGGAPTVSATTGGPSLAAGQDTFFVLPASWGQALADGTAGGIGLYASGGTPYIITDGRSTWGPAWNVLINWSR